MGEYDLPISKGGGICCGGKASGPSTDAQLQTARLNFSAWVEVNLDHLQANLTELERHCRVPILPVLKGDAYGHGAPAVAVFFADVGVSKAGGEYG